MINPEQHSMTDTTHRDGHYNTILDALNNNDTEINLYRHVYNVKTSRNGILVYLHDLKFKAKKKNITETDTTRFWS